MSGRLRKTFRSIAGRGLLGREAKTRVEQESVAPIPVEVPEPTPRPEAPDRIAAAQKRLLKEIPPLDEDQSSSKRAKKSKPKKKKKA